MNTRRVLFYPVAILAVIISLYPLAYIVLGHEMGVLTFKDEHLLQSLAYNLGFYGHVISAGIALALGWTQFVTKWRAKYLDRHRILGKIYVLAVLVGGISGLCIAPYASTSTIGKLGFATLGVIWLYVTTMAYTSIKAKNITAHEKWMIYSYACTFAAVMLRLWLPLLTILLGDFDPAYEIVAWLCWVPNLVVAYFIVK